MSEKQIEEWLIRISIFSAVLIIFSLLIDKLSRSEQSLDDDTALTNNRK